jgi:putative transposase
MDVKAYGIDLREKIVEFVKNGGSKLEAARRFGVARQTVYNFLSMEGKGTLAPKKSWGKWRKLDPEKLRHYIKTHPSATLMEMTRSMGVSHNAIWSRLRKLGISLKKTHEVHRKS